MVSAIAFSALMALSLTPALCATLLKPSRPGTATPARASSAGSTAARWRADRYRDRRLVAEAHRTADADLCGAAGRPGLGVRSAAGGFLPVDDQGFITTDVQTPPDSSTRAPNAVEKVEKYLLQRPGRERHVPHRLQLPRPGMNTAQAFVTLKDWSERGAERFRRRDRRRHQPRSAVDPRCQDFRAAAAADRQSRQFLGLQFRLQDRGQKGYPALCGDRQLIAEASAARCCRTSMSKACRRRRRSIS